jgi:uncharacterized protein YjbI with pentapeptide repeats
VANSEHIEILLRGPRAWNAWRQENPSQIPDLDEVTLSLSERQLGPINGGPVDLSSASLRRASLRSASLTEANLEGADLSEADLAYARLDHANLQSADLTGARLDYADFSGAVLTDANLCGVNMQLVQNLMQDQINQSICDLATVFPDPLVSPVSRLEGIHQTKLVDLATILVGKDK